MLYCHPLRVQKDPTFLLIIRILYKGKGIIFVRGYEGQGLISIPSDRVLCISTEFIYQHSIRKSGIIKNKTLVCMCVCVCKHLKTQKETQAER